MEEKLGKQTNTRTRTFFFTLNMYVDSRNKNVEHRSFIIKIYHLKHLNWNRCCSKLLSTICLKIKFMYVAQTKSVSDFFTVSISVSRDFHFRHDFVFIAYKFVSFFSLIYFIPFHSIGLCEFSLKKMFYVPKIITQRKISCFMS